MKLHRNETSPGHGDTETDPVIRPAGGPGFICQVRIVGVNEVKLRFFGNARKHRMVRTKANAVPPHVGNFEGSAFLPQVRGKPFDFTRNNSEATGVVLLAPIEEDLHAEADSQDRFALSHPSFQMHLQPAPPEILHRSAGRADTRKNDTIGLLQ